MLRKTRLALAIGIVFTSSTTLAASSFFSSFTAMTGDVGTGLPAATPFRLSSPNFSQVTIADRATQNALVPGSNSGAWDMITANETGLNAGRYLFTPFETGSAGVQRIDRLDPNYNTRTVTIVAPGTQSFVSGDASRWAPWGGYLTGEESWGTSSTRGRLFEITNPTTAAVNGGTFVARNVIPRVSHEGLAFDASKRMYFVDELNGGSIYKYVSQQPGAASGSGYFDKGQTFVLKVGAGGQFEGANGAAITGVATWEAITTTAGTPLATTASALLNLGGGSFAMDGRAAATLVSGSGYNRPEDMEVQTLANGTQIIYFTTTDSQDNGSGRGRVYSLNLSSNEVKLFASAGTIDMATGVAAGAAWRNPDNLAIDADGNIYVIEDQPGGVADIWFARDADRDGVAESVGKWASLSTAGAEPTGLYFDKFDPNVAYVNVQHPDSGVDRMIQITAVPEPETYALMLSGLGLVGYALRRRQRKVNALRFHA